MSPEKFNPVGTAIILENSGSLRKTKFNLWSRKVQTAIINILSFLFDFASRNISEKIFSVRSGFYLFWSNFAHYSISSVVPHVVMLTCDL